MRMGGQVVAFAASGQALSNGYGLAFLGIDIFSHSHICNSQSEGFGGAAALDRAGSLDGKPNSA